VTEKLEENQNWNDSSKSSQNEDSANNSMKATGNKPVRFLQGLFPPRLISIVKRRRSRK
jgi:hypothetical protein